MARVTHVAHIQSERELQQVNNAVAVRIVQAPRLAGSAMAVAQVVNASSTATVAVSESTLSFAAVTRTQ